MRKSLLSLTLPVFLAVPFLTVNPVQAQVSVYRTSDRQVQTLLTRVQTRTDNFRRSIQNVVNRRAGGAGGQDSITSYIDNLQTATDALRQRIDSRNSTAADAQEVLNRAAVIDNLMRGNRFPVATQNQWSLLRADLTTLATYYNIRWDWNTAVVNDGNTGNAGNLGGSSYRTTDVNLRNLLTRIETKTDAYKREIDASLGRGANSRTRSQDTLIAYVSDFEKATDALKQKFDARRSVGADAEEVLNRAYYINGFMRDYRFSPAAEGQWNLIRTDLNTLAGYYNVAWNWNRQYSPASGFDTMLTGTYRLNASQSDDVRGIIDRTVSSIYAVNQRENVRRNLERRLTSPDMLVIQKSGNQVTIGSSNLPQVTFAADGTARTETTPNGRTVRVTATTNYDGVTLSYEGDRTNDFYVNFVTSNNNQLRVVRRINLENRSETVTVASVYDRVSQNADFSMVNGNNNVGYNNPSYNNGQNSGTYNTFVIPNGTPVVAVLNTPLSTKTSVNGDRFAMEVRSPSQFSGAIIEGHVSSTEQSGRVTGRAQVALNFDTIRLPNGGTHRFSGIVEQVRQPNGDTVNVNNEGVARDNNQTTKTVTRTGIGAALGAIIGAVAGGGEGAAIGAGIGAGAGAGSVILQGRDNLDIQSGSEFRITSSAPANMRNNY